MYKRIVLAVDLAEPTPNPKGLPEAVELAKAGGGELRLVNVQPVIPATFMEYVPVDFDVEQATRAKEALNAILAWPRIVWINPTPPSAWNHSLSTSMIAEIFQHRMYPLTPDGVEAAMRALAA